MCETCNSEWTECDRTRRISVGFCKELVRTDSKADLSVISAVELFLQKEGWSDFLWPIGSYSAWIFRWLRACVFSFSQPCFIFCSSVSTWSWMSFFWILRFKKIRDGCICHFHVGNFLEWIHLRTTFHLQHELDHESWPYRMWQITWLITIDHYFSNH